MKLLRGCIAGRHVAGRTLLRARLRTQGRSRSGTTSVRRRRCWARPCHHRLCRPATGARRRPCIRRSMRDTRLPADFAPDKERRIRLAVRRIDDGPRVRIGHRPSNSHRTSAEARPANQFCPARVFRRQNSTYGLPRLRDIQGAIDSCQVRSCWNYDGRGANRWSHAAASSSSGRLIAGAGGAANCSLIVMTESSSTHDARTRIGSRTPSTET